MVTEPEKAGLHRSSPEEVEALVEGLDLVGLSVSGAGWLNGLQDFQVSLEDGRVLIFRDCLQVSFHRPLVTPERSPIQAWWSDEPSPLLLSLDLRIRFLYKHLVLEIGDALLRLAFREIEID